MTEMEYTTLGGTGLEVSRFALGCMNFGSGEPWMIGDEERSRELIERALEMGINVVNCLGVKWFGRLRLSSSRKTTSSVRPRGFPWVSRTLPSDHRPDSLGRSDGSRSGRPRPPMPAVVIRKSEIFVITKDSVFRSTPSEQREGC